MSVLASTSRESSDMSVTCLPAFLWAALNSLKFSTKFCGNTAMSLLFCCSSPHLNSSCATSVQQTCMRCCGACFMTPPGSACHFWQL